MIRVYTMITTTKVVMISESDKYFRVLLHCRQSIDSRQTKYCRGLDKLMRYTHLINQMNVGGIISTLFSGHQFGVGNNPDPAQVQPVAVKANVNGVGKVTI